MKWLKSGGSSEDNSWISASDMMAGLMMIFLFISILYIRNLSQYFDAVNNVRDDICSDLKNEFRRDQEDWNMTICEGGLVIQFQGDTTFEKNSAELSEQFQATLNSFFPRLMGVVWNYRQQVRELRIEGHTDSSTRRFDTPLTGYLYNTKLSQDRSRAVMEYALNINDIQQTPDYVQWSFENLTAHGLSSSNLILVDGSEDAARSRRVEFRLMTAAEEDLINLVDDIRNEVKR